jgi:hypothetical protein
MRNLLNLLIGTFKECGSKNLLTANDDRDFHDMELQNFQEEEMSSLISDEDYDDDISPKVNQAQTLPEGWTWIDYDDGSGVINSPEGAASFSYDLQTQEYVSPDGNGHFWHEYPCGMGLLDFKTYAEKYIRERILPKNDNTLLKEGLGLAGSSGQLERNNP